MGCGVITVYSRYPRAPNPSTARGAREALELPEPLAISVEQPDVAPEDIQRAPYKAQFKRVYLRRTILIDLDIQQDARLVHSYVKV